MKCRGLAAPTAPHLIVMLVLTTFGNVALHVLPRHRLCDVRSRTIANSRCVARALLFAIGTRASQVDEVNQWKAQSPSPC